MLSEMVLLSQLTYLLTQAYVEPKQRIKGEKLSPIAEKIIELLVQAFGKEMHQFAQSLSRGRYDSRDAVQDAWLSFIQKAKWQAYNPNKATSGARAWFRSVYRNSIKDFHRIQVKIIDRECSLDELENRYEEEEY